MSSINYTYGVTQGLNRVRRPAATEALKKSQPISWIATPAINDYNDCIDCNWAATMASITIRDLDERTKSRLRIRAAHHSRSMEDEARTILRNALSEDAQPAKDLASAVRERFKPLGGVELVLAVREPMREPPKPGK